jgi:hypothetical protein
MLPVPPRHGVISNAPEVPPVNPVALAVSVYAVPVLSIDKSLKVATPLTALMVTVPESIPPPGFDPMATVSDAALLVTRLLPASRTWTVTAGEITTPA